MKMSPIKEVQNLKTSADTLHEQSSFQDNPPYFNHRRLQPTKEMLAPPKPQDNYNHLSPAVSGADYGRQRLATRGEQPFHDYDQVAPDQYDSIAFREHQRNVIGQDYKPVSKNTSENKKIVLPEVHLNAVPLVNYEPIDINLLEPADAALPRCKPVVDGCKSSFPANTELSPHNSDRSAETKSLLSSENSSLSINLPKSPVIPVGSDGYLSSDSLDSLVRLREKRSQFVIPASSALSAPNSHHLYVSPNRTSNESLSKYFMKPIPKPGIKMAATSLPDLYVDCHNPNSLKTNKAQSATRQKTKTLLALSEDEQKPYVREPISYFRPVKNSKKKSQKYNVPRPSASSIFIQSAYTTEDEVKKIQQHLENVAVASSQYLSPAESDGESFVSKIGTTPLYDSPRISPWNSPASSSISLGRSLPDEKSSSLYDIPPNH